MELEKNCVTCLRKLDTAKEPCRSCAKLDHTLMRVVWTKWKGVRDRRTRMGNTKQQRTD